MTTPTPPIALPPHALLDQLCTGNAQPQSLTASLHITLDELDNALHHVSTEDYVHLERDLVATQLQALSLRFAAGTFARLIKLTECDKPEVARRACMAVLDMAMLPMITDAVCPNDSMLSRKNPLIDMRANHEDWARELMEIAQIDPHELAAEVEADEQAKADAADAEDDEELHEIIEKAVTDLNAQGYYYKGNALWGDERDNEGHEGQTTRPAALPVPAAPPEPPAPPAPTPAVWCSFLLALLLTLPSWLALAPAAVASFALPLIAHYHAPPMARRQDIRRLAMQVLYQIDLRGEADVHAIRQAPADEHDDEATHQAGLTLALAAWDHHVDADTLAAELAPDWPTYRQPPVDRAILRLAYHEMVSGYAPPKVAINEAIELSKHYSSELSPPFINGVLDKMAKRLAAEKRIPEAQSLQEPPTSDQWLAEALGSTAKSKAKSEKLQADDHQHTPERPPDSSAADA